MRTRPNANGRRKPPPDAARRGAPPVTRQTHAVIAGAGIGGLAAAIALARAGLRVTLIERAPVLGEAGAGLQLAPNATGRLREMGLLDKILKYATAPEALRIRRARDGHELARLPLGPIADFRWGAPYLVIHRADLQRALMEACAAEPAISLRAGVRVAGFAVAGDRVEIGAREGETMTRFDGDFLVGADGLRSVVRERLGLGPSDAPVWSGRTAWRALVPAAAAPPVALRVETNLWLGPRAHLVHYPVRHGEFVNVVAIAEDGWRGEDADDLWNVSSRPAEISPRFSAWTDEARAVVSSAREWLRWPLFDRAPSARWRVDRVALLGDAAHPMLPFFAQGAAQAIEDAAALGAAFAARPGDVNGALAAYETARTRRAGGVVIASRKQGSIYHMRGPMAFARDQVMQRLGPIRMMNRLDWLYNHVDA